MRNYISYILLFSLFISCIRIDDPVNIEPGKDRLTPNGFFILNEGNFGWGNGSLTYYSYDSLKTYNNFFQSVNNRPLGDLPYSMLIHNDDMYIVINNSEKIEVIDRRSLESKATITGIISPRNIAVTGPNRAYVTSMYSDTVTILDLKTNKISGIINLRNSSESIVVVGNKSFIANWIGGNEVFIIDNEIDQVIDSVEVGIEPESMVVDNRGIVWVLCNGGYTRENYAELVTINPQTHEVMNRLQFPSKINSPLCLQADNNGDTLFYIDGGIHCMNILSEELPSEPFINNNDHQFYRIGINPANGDIVATDAVDYQQNGSFMIYSRRGIYTLSDQAGIIPGNSIFLVNNGNFIE